MPSVRVCARICFGCGWLGLGSARNGASRTYSAVEVSSATTSVACGSCTGSRGEPSNAFQIATFVARIRRRGGVAADSPYAMNRECPWTVFEFAL